MKDPARLRVLWQKGRNYYQSFFSELSEVQKSMPPAEFVQWCQNELGLTIGIMVNASGLLKKVDAALEREQLATARTAEQQQKILAAIAKNEEKARLTAEKLEIARQKKEAINRKRKQANDRRYRRNQRKKKKEKAKALHLAAE